MILQLSGYVHNSRRERQNKRGLLLGIYGGLGHHRYPGIGSGDVYDAWETLHFEIYLSATAANVVIEWNHDIGGFEGGASAQGALVSPIYDPHLQAYPWMHNSERYARWMQAAVFQAIWRTHMASPGDPTPWNYPNFEVMKQAYQLRNALVPYIYSAAFDAYKSGVIYTHPLYYDFPEEEMAYLLSTPRGPTKAVQHCFGDAFVVAPITQVIKIFCLLLKIACSLLKIACLFLKIACLLILSWRPSRSPRRRAITPRRRRRAVPQRSSRSTASTPPPGPAPRWRRPPLPRAPPPAARAPAAPASRLTRSRTTSPARRPACRASRAAG